MIIFGEIFKSYATHEKKPKTNPNFLKPPPPVKVYTLRLLSSYGVNNVYISQMKKILSFLM